jgi:hypothetical protein
MEFKFNTIVQLLVDQGLLEKKKAVSAQKVSQKRHTKHALVDVLKELGYLALRRYSEYP